MRSAIVKTAFLCVLSAYSVFYKYPVVIQTPLLKEEKLIAKHLPLDAEKLLYNGREYQL
ncbi:hypothetical protein [Clostridium thermarum]|uniref:hypothetical protein n=1 Tax=Clostridium thermarum TaxID=1716543 RepID=UPI0013D0B734|nr:hypothetical protein [Clostridium thermarum]